MKRSLRSQILRLLEKRLGGHISFNLFGRYVTIYGFNAMHVAINIRTRRWGYVCFHPPIVLYRRRWPWYLYVSPNGTPWGATWIIGPGHDAVTKWEARGRYLKFGHNFPINRYDHKDYHFARLLNKPAHQEDGFSERRGKS